MAEPRTILVILGTRPEAIKLFPVARALQAETRLRTLVVTTGQHREMVDQILGPFGIVPDHDLDIMRPDQTLNEIVCRVIPRLEALYLEEKPALVLVQGDTTSAFCAGLAAFHRRIAVGHVEAGLRSFNRFHPYPEEANRRMLACVTDVHLAATPWGAKNLLAEGVPADEITVTGNTGIDSLLETLARTDLLERHRAPEPKIVEGERLVLITLHRRENWMSGGLDQVLAALATAAAEFPSVRFVYPVHRNPRVQEPARRILGGRPNIHLLDPLPYIPFVDLMARACLILTDSGGIQEEAPSLGVPVLVTRETTERPEGVECGANQLVGTRADAVLEALRRHLSRPPQGSGPRPRPNPFGDGRASGRILKAVLHHFGFGEAPSQFEPPALTLSSATRQVAGAS